jgi:hypothetical protein
MRLDLRTVIAGCALLVTPAAAWVELRVAVSRLEEKVNQIEKRLEAEARLAGQP